MANADRDSFSSPLKPFSAVGEQIKEVRPFWLALRGHWEQILGSCLALFVFSVYLWTLCPTIFPGESAFACVNVLQAWPGHDFVGHPVASLAARLFTWFCPGDLPFRLSLFSALCGAGAIFWLFKGVTLVLYDAMSEERWLYPLNEDALAEEAGAEGIPGPPDAIDAINDFAHRIAMVGGAISAIVFAFCTPFWLASTRFHYQTFEVFLVIAVCYGLIRYWVTASVRALIIAGILIGAGLVESTCFILILPIALFCLIYGGYRHGHISTSFIALLVLYMAIGFVLAGVAQVMWLMTSSGDFSVHAMMKIATLWGQNQRNGFVAILEHKGWLLMLIEGVIPLLLAYAARYPIAYTYFLSPRTRTALAHERTNWHEEQDFLSGFSWSVAVFVLLGVVAHAVLNLPGSPWYLSRANTYLPIMPMLGIAVTAGFLFAYGLLFGFQHLDESAEGAEKRAGKNLFSAGYLMRAGVVSVTLVLIAVSVVRNRIDVDGSKAAFVDVMCREILKAAPQARCFVTDGSFDMNLLMQAWMQKRMISLINAQDFNQHIADAGVAPEKGKNATTFLVDWLSSNPDARDQVAMLDAPRLWFNAGLQAVPATLVYLGAKPGTRVDVQSLLKQQRLFWDTNKNLLVGTDPRLMNLRRIQTQLRMQISRIANDLGVFCLHQKADSDARTAFDFALEVDPNNLSAWVNRTATQFENSRTNAIGAVDHDVEKMIAVMKKVPYCSSLTEAERHYGALHLPAVEYFASLCLSRTTPAVVQKASALIDQLREYVQNALQVNARRTVSPLIAYRDGLTDEEMTRVIEAMTGGYWKAAETQLKTILRIKRTSLVAWSLLAEVLMNQQKLEEIQNTVLPEMRLVAGDSGSEWVDMTEGCFMLRRANPDYRAAHDCFLRALTRNPNIEEAQNMVIQTALSLKNEAMIEKDCTTILAHTRQHPMANAVLGTLRLNQNRLEEAEAALNASIAVQPSATALNDLGETLRRMRRGQAAERMVRRALLLKPSCYQAWDTLALILTDQGRLDEASDAHRAALRFCQTDIRLFLNAAKLEQTRGDYKAARSLLQKSSPLLTHIATSYKECHDALLKSLPRE